jgi:hypothetical protein
MSSRVVDAGRAALIEKLLKFVEPRTPSPAHPFAWTPPLKDVSMQSGQNRTTTTSVPYAIE